MDNSMLTEKVGLLGNLILREATTFEFFFFFNVTFGVISVGCIFSKQLESSWPWYLKKKNNQQSKMHFLKYLFVREKFTAYGGWVSVKVDNFQIEIV